MNTKQSNRTRLTWVAGLLAAVALAGPGYGAGAPNAADAAQSRNMDALRALLKQRVDVNAAQPDGTTALHWAAHWNDPEAVNLLLRAGANAKTADRKSTRLNSSHSRASRMPSSA